MRSIQEIIRMNKVAEERFFARQRAVETTEDTEEIAIHCPCCENLLLIHPDGKVEAIGG